MVYVPTRGDVAPQFGPGIAQLPDVHGTTVSRDVYNDPMRFELERERVLRRQWLLAGRSAEIANSGDWLSYEGHGETVVVTRQPDGTLAGFHNVCPHRGTAFVTAETGCGARRFTCPYHGWVFDTTGKVIGVPERENFEPAHLDGLRTPSVAADEWGGWVWINMAGADAVPLLDSIGPDITADLGQFRMEDMILHEKQVFEVPVSYKAIVDGFNEVYHATQLHHTTPEFTKASRQTAFRITGNNSMMFVPRPSTLDELAATQDHHRYTICHYVLFPNTVFNCNPEHIQVFNPVPIDVDRTKFICWELIYDGDRSDPEYETYYNRTMAHWKTLQGVVAEDLSIYTQLARTKKSMGYSRNILSTHECKIGRYHEVMDDMIRDQR